MKVALRWKSKMAFEATVGDHRVELDTSTENGGSDSAPSPKQLVLAALCGCTAMDVVLFLQKMRQTVTGCEVDAEADQTTSQPAVFQRIHLVYRISGRDLRAEKVVNAVELSQTKYCGVSAMLSRTATIDYRILLEGSPIGSGTARF
jgi:putative redox protein